MARKIEFSDGERDVVFVWFREDFEYKIMVSNFKTIATARIV